MEAAATGRPGDAGAALLEHYDRYLACVHGYVVRRAPQRIAEDLTAETFLAAVASIRRGVVEEVTEAWLIGIARHKLADHWRRREREDRRLEAVAGGLDDTTDPWGEVIDQEVASVVLGTLRPEHRSALTLRYLDGLSVREVASHLDRSPAGVEALLTRAKHAFRAAYGEENDAS